MKACSVSLLDGLVSSLSGLRAFLSGTLALDWNWRLPTPEPFDAGPLRRHGNRLAGPVAYALQGGMPDFAPPAWQPGRDALHRFSVLLSGSLARAVQDRLLHVRRLRHWQRARQVMEGAFGFHHGHHFFHAAPLGWVNRAGLTEPQVTKAIAYFLQSEDPVTREGRIRALLSALGSRLEDGAVKARATDQAPVTGTRKSMDLLVEWQDSRGFDRAAVIEAKFGHDVTKGQLKTYRHHLRRVERRYRRAEHDGGPEPELLLLVSPSYRRSIARALAKNKHWRWKSWRSLLLAYDRFLDPQHDDVEFRRFRRTLWDRAGQEPSPPPYPVLWRR